MNIKALREIPPWEWPENAGELFLDLLRNRHADGSDRLLAAELAGDSTVINDELAVALLSIVYDEGESETLRGRAAISLGPALEYAFTDGFDDPEDEMISEPMFRKIQEALQKLYADSRAPDFVRRMVLEASVRAPENWHKSAVRAAYRRGEESWKLTAVFCMQFIGGFEKEILESLKSKDPNIHYEAVCAAGTWELNAAWPHISALITSRHTDKDTLLAAIEAAAFIRPHEASDLLGPLLEDEDEDIVDAVHEALAMAGGLEDEDEGDDGKILH